MKQRIIATILLLVTVLTTFAGCANYAFAEDKNFADYASVNYDELMKALHTIEIEEEDFGPEEDRQAIVVDEIYNTILTALAKNADKKLKNGTISERDMVEYYYYCIYDGHSYGYAMTTTSNTNVASSASDSEKELKKAIVNAVIGYTFDEETAYSIKTTLTNEKITDTDKIVVSYTLKTENNGVTTYTDYANLTIDNTHELFKAIITENNEAVLIGSYKPGESVTVGEHVYKNIVISHIVENAGISVDVKHTTEDEQDVVAYTAEGVKTNITIPEGAEVTYRVFPVAFVKAPEVTAELVVRYVLGDDISTSDLAVLSSEEYTLEDGTTVKALVEALAAEYKQDAAHYETLDYVVAAKENLTNERKAAKDQAVKDAIDALSKATKVIDGTTTKVTKTILDQYNEGKSDEDKAADIYAVFAALKEADGKIKFSSLIDGGILTLYTYKNASGVSAVTLVNDINNEYDADVNTAYESYTKDLDSKKAGNEIDVADKRERYEDAVAQAQNSAVNAIITNILGCKNGDASVQGVIVEQYNNSAYKTEFTAYDLIKNILLTSSSSATTFSFIEDLSDYVYGTSNVDDEERETFSSILTDLVAEFGKTTSDYENVESVKDAKGAVDAKALEIDGYLTISKYASNLKEYKKGDETAFDALAKVYIEKNPSTVFVLKDAKKNQKLASSYASTVLQLILDDEDNLQAYKDALTAEYVKKEGAVTSATTAVEEFELAVKVNGLNNELSDLEELYADAQEAAHENAVNALVAKLLSGVLTEEHDGETETHKLSVVLAERYVENTLNTKINTYNTNVQNKLAKEIYEIINDKNIVTVNNQHEAYPEHLIKDFVKTIKAGYEYTYYTGTSTQTTPGTPAAGVTPEMRAEYDKWIKVYDEANAAITSAETGISNSITAYVTALVTIYDMEVVIFARSAEDTDAPYFGEANDFNALVKAYFDANTAYNTANTENTKAKTRLTTAEKALAEAEKYLELAKDEKVGIFDFEAQAAKRAAIKDAKANVKAAKAEVEAADVAINGTKKNPNGTKKALEDATNVLADAKDKLVEAFSKTGDRTEFVESEETFSLKKSTYTSASTSYKDELTRYDTYYNSYKTAYDNAEAAVTEAGEGATAEQIKARDDAKAKLDKLVEDYTKDTDAYYKAAKEYVEAALVYYANANAVKDYAKTDYDAAVAVLDDKKDEEGNVTEEGLRTKIANAEKDTAGETLKNVDAFATFEDYLVFVLGYNYETVLREEAVKMLDEQIRVYAVAKALNEGVVANGATVVIDENTTITVEGYKAAIEAREETFKGLLSHSLTHDDEDMKPAKLERKLKKSWKELLETTDDVLVTKKVYREYKNELGRSNYIYSKNQYGDNNLRMYLQFENLLTYLLFTDYQVNDYAAHDGEYTVKENEDGTLEYLFITYSFKAEDAE